MAQPRPVLRLHHAPKGFCDVMVHGNIALYNGSLAEAINHYTEVLYNLSPGHVCAFLNRSMAYLESGYWELAVMDAYRACLAASELRQGTEVAKRRLKDVARYLRAEQLHVYANDIWTKPKDWTNEVRWVSSPLASVVINATPGVTVPPFVISGISFVTSLEIRAVYRLSGALFMVGDGARKDAFERIDDARSKLYMLSWESEWFHKLGNEIMLQLASEVDPIDAEKLKLLGRDTPQKRNERLTKVRESMKATTSRHAYGDYPWNAYEPKPEHPGWHEQIKTLVDTGSNNCSAVLVRPEADDTSAEGSKPYIELRAKRDIKSGEILLSEQTLSNVTTSIPEDVEKNRRAGISEYYFCNTCASLLDVPLQYPQEFQKTKTPVQSETALETPDLSPLTRAFQDLDGNTQGSPSTGSIDPEDLAMSPDIPNAPLQSSSRRDFMLCSPDHLVPTCSVNCRELSEDFENGLCSTNIEQQLRLSQFHALKPRSITDTKNQCLRDLIFLRYITLAINVHENPLRIGDVAFATCGPKTHNRDSEPWSFVSHVIRPVRYLHQLFENSNTDQFLKLSQVDGWVVYTLLAKIHCAMQISKTPNYYKRFDMSGMLTIFGPWNNKGPGGEVISNTSNTINTATTTETDKELETGNGNDGENEKSIWIASIHPLLNMIRIANPIKGEVPNVAAVKREGVSVYAMKKGIRAGEVLLRGQPLGEVVEEEEDIGPADDMDDGEGEMEETGEGEETRVWMDDSDMDGDGEEAHLEDMSEFLEDMSEFLEDMSEVLEGMDDEMVEEGEGLGEHW